MRPAAAAATLSAVLLIAGAAEAGPLRVMTLDQCADQFALALAPDADLVLSPRADDDDSWMREAARGRTRMRPTLESAVAFQPDVVIRYWGGDARLLRALEARGATVVNLADATDFPGVRANVEAAAAALEKPEAGRRMIARMDARLAAAGQGGPRGGAMYLTPGGYTAGPGTLIHAVLGAAGYANLTLAAGYAPVSVERIALAPPLRLVLGFFDLPRLEWRGPGRHPVVARVARIRPAARLPGAALTCPAWFAADAAALLAQADRGTGG